MSNKNMILGLLLAMFFVFLLGKLPTTNANDMVFERKLTASKYWREIQLCYNNFIGKDWNKSMKYEKRCRVLWTAWTEEEKSHEGISR